MLLNANESCDCQDSLPIATMATTIIPFHEVIPGSEGVRFTTIENVPYMSVRDIIMVVCDKDNNDAGQIWRRLPEDYKKELQPFLLQCQFPGRGQSEQPVITLPGAMKLIMWLPGNMAREFRSQACEILTRHLTGDPSLAVDTQKNAEMGIVAACQLFLQESFTAADSKHRENSDIAYIYASVSAAFPGLIKIGRTTDLVSRISSLNTGCAPKPHRLVAVVPTFNAVRDEKMAHAFFADLREEGEFFRTSVESVERFFELHILPEYKAELQTQSQFKVQSEFDCGDSSSPQDGVSGFWNSLNTSIFVLD